MNADNLGNITAINGNLITVAFKTKVKQNEVGHVLAGEARLKSEVIRIQGSKAQLQVYEDTRGIKVGDQVEFSGELLSVLLGPGLLGKVYDGLQNPLPQMAETYGFFLARGIALPPLDERKPWPFEPEVREGDRVRAGHFIGSVPEGLFKHRIMVPFDLPGEARVISVAASGDYLVGDRVARMEDREGRIVDAGLSIRWPVRIPIAAYVERLRPIEPLVTRIRIVDTLFPIAKGGTYCIPGPFGAGKTVLQQITARHAEVDVVIVAACGERAGEVVELLKEFPTLTDPRTGRSLMERTIIICNTSSMPVASRESSVYTAVTLAEYYRQMGLQVLLLADSTSRWAQAMREISGRLEEIPGDEAYPAYLESRIAGFYERAGRVRLFNGETGSVTIGGTVSPAGGTFEEPVTQGTLKVVGAFHGLSRDRANTRRFPAIDPHESWSKYPVFIVPERVKVARSTLFKGREVNQMMKVVGEEATSLEDYLHYLKSEFLDQVYLHQDAFDEVEGSTTRERQDHVFGFVLDILEGTFSFSGKEEALQFFQGLRLQFLNWNYTEWGSEEFEEMEKKLRRMLEGTGLHEEGL
jgi:V/A-type H+/Na+-transporting ATPase subunit A